MSMDNTNKTIFGMPIHTVEPDRMLEEMLDASTGTVFVIGEKTLPQHEGDDQVELVMAQIIRSKS